MCTVTLLFPSNPIQASVRTFNLLFIILSRHHTLLRSHFSPQSQSILALRVACFLSVRYSTPLPPSLPPSPQPASCPFLRHPTDPCSIAHSSSHQVRVEIVWFPIRLSWRVTSLWIFADHMTESRTDHRSSKGRQDEAFVWAKAERQSIYFKNLHEDFKNSTELSHLMQ